MFSSRRCILKFLVPLFLCCYIAARPSFRHKRSIYGLDSTGPYLPPPFGPVPFAPFGLGSPFAQPPFALPYHSYAPPPYAAPNSYPLPPFYPPHPYQNPIFAPSFPSPLYRPPPYFPPVVAPVAPIGPPPAPIIVPAKTAAALSIASIIHAFIARKFYPPVLPVPIARPVPYPVAERIPFQRHAPATILQPISEKAAVHKTLPENICIQNISDIVLENSIFEDITSTTEAPWQPTLIPISQ
ncbi:pistil-specific extensin-like protein [Rhagoletis pomonella]|uniref:pistil-specific extensin-like protein n=1 Tax=Rhagoletis pomonella TaxID=28610 RepID=UPI00177C0607|nr:pistil-specific extensin-like protein [Rhagoletis pomonella]